MRARWRGPGRADRRRAARRSPSRPRARGRSAPGHDPPRSSAVTRPARNASPLPTRVAVAHVQPPLVDRAVRGGDGDAFGAAGHDPRVTVPAGELAELHRGGDGLGGARRRDAQQLGSLDAVHLDDVGHRLDRQTQTLSLRVERRADAGGARLAEQIAVPRVRHAARQRAADREPGGVGQHGGHGLGQLDPRGRRNDRPVLVELREAPGGSIRHRQRRPVLTVTPHERPGHALGLELLTDPATGVATQDGRDPNVGPQGPGRPGHVQPLATGRLHEPERPVDLARDEALDLEELVDRRVRRQADEHGAYDSRVEAGGAPADRLRQGRHHARARRRDRERGEHPAAPRRRRGRRDHPCGRPRGPRRPRAPHRRARGTLRCPPATRWPASGGDLPARWIIYTAGPVWRGRPRDRELLRACHRSCLRVAGRAGGSNDRVPRDLDRRVRLSPRGGGPDRDRGGANGRHRRRGGPIRRSSTRAPTRRSWPRWPPPRARLPEGRPEVGADP
ncbi:MAG: hypothetical protein KatS3mg013_1849 [Actinomycetota bacterium]|nr:MAG: hypothetical protein KatS3mg013_1849 [Actinomycetota bacterium]